MDRGRPPALEIGGSWRTISVFISSTFRDMHAERDQLVKIVFPSLRERLQPYRVHLVDVDLRWGVTQEQSDNDAAADLCLAQVDACRPFFIGVLGERYGYVPHGQPFGSSVTDLEVNAGARANPRALVFFRDPAFIDEVPAAKRADVEAESDEARWKLAELKEAIRRAELDVPPLESFPCSYRGLRVNPLLLRAGRGSALDRVARDGVVEPAEYAALDAASRQLVDREGFVYTGGLEAFGQAVEERLWGAIRVELELPDEPPAEPTPGDVLDAELHYHERFIESRLRVHVERSRINRRMLEHATGTEPRPLLLTGPPGSGKSALMARFVRALEPTAGLVIAHFIGAGPGSAGLRQMLRRFCAILRARVSGTGDGAELPVATDELIAEFGRLAASIAPQDRVYLVIDALDQLDSTDNARAMHWLPRTLPPQLRVIVSCSNDRAAAGAEPVLAAFRHRPHRRLQVTPLTNRERLAIVRDVPSLSAKTLDRGQIELLTSNPATRNPLFLLVALEELRGFGSFEQLTERIAAFPQRGDTLTAIFQQVMERLEEDFGPALVRRCLSCLACSRNGLSERELAELLAGGDLGGDALYAVLRQIRPYTQPRGPLVDFFHRNFRQAAAQRYLGSAGRRRQANAVLAAYFRGKIDPGGTGEWSGDYPRALGELPHHLAEAGERKALRGMVMDFRFMSAKLVAFGVQDLIEDFDLALSHTPRNAKAATTLTMLRRALRLSANQLASDPTQLLTQLWGRLLYEDSGGVPSALEAFAASATRPWLRLWTSSLTAASGPLIWSGSAPPGDAKVCLSGDAAIVAVAAKDGSLWVFSTHSAAPLFVLSGRPRPGAVLDVVMTDGDRTVTVLREDGSLDLWDLADQGLQHRHPRVDVSSAGVAVRAGATDGELVMLGLADGMVALRRIGDPAFRRALEGHAAEVQAVAFNVAAGRAVAGYADGHVKAWDLDSGETIGDDESMPPIGEEDWKHGGFGESPANAVQLADDGHRVFIGHAEKRFSNLEGSAFSTSDIRGLVSQRDLASGETLSALEAYSDGPVADLAISPDQRFGVTLSEQHQLKLWDLSGADAQAALEQHAESDPIVAVTPDGRRVLSTADDGFLLVWELASGELQRLRGYRDPAFALRVSADSRFAIVMSAGHCQVWDLKSLGLGAILGSIATSDDFGIPAVWIRAVVPLATGNRALTVASDGAVTTWNLETGKPTGEPEALGETVVDAAASACARWLLYAPDVSSLVLHDRTHRQADRRRVLDTASGVARILPAPDRGRFRIELWSGAAWEWDPERETPEPAAGAAGRFALHAVTPDGLYAVGYDGNGTLAVIDRRADTALATYTAEATFTSFAVSPDGQLVATGDRAKTVHILRLMPGCRP
ncbi:MAG TPA: DUF4062 domain-containing protein [Solirubrobacter sp.]